MGKSMMQARGVPKCFWVEAVATAVYLLNISPTKVIFNRTPYEAWRVTGQVALMIERADWVSCLIWDLEQFHGVQRSRKWWPYQLQRLNIL
ncbi:uncharacterized protein LOC129884813 isoform X2 [Solanum dulcamara]|uniref:uncharacterized protein LOC129884813 isoform X2 n=1 Tax=Solanum dulcamara TaxID=45834 RepID=UPI0024854BF6|nr:uncharacterized protein LOC129884813 isoform X2 [Solanum dulcamara]